MITLGASYAIDSAKHVTVETAYSNADPNMFSKIDNAAHALLPEQPAAVADAIVAYMKQLGA